jgi:small conductance mechanosensitive channel
VGVLELADSSVNFAVRPWVKADDYWDIFFEFQENIKRRLDKEGISIPFPQRDIHVFQNNN